MNERSKMALLLALLGAGAFLWFTQAGKKIAAEAGTVLTSATLKIVDLANSTLQLIKRFEGFSAVPYRDANGFSIGYGHFIVPGESFTTLTEPEAYDLLRFDVRRFSDAVKTAVTVPLTQSQFDALVSLAYNIGASAFSGSTLVRLLNAGDYAGAAAQFARWNKSQGTVLPVLVSRREQERQVFLS